MNACYFRRVAALALVLAAGGTSPILGQPVFRVLSYMDQYSPPKGLTEVTPGIFYLPSGIYLFSITTTGSKTAIDSLYNADGALAPVVAAADGRFYDSSWPGYNPDQANPATVYSVGATPETLKVYAPQTIAPVLTQGLPNSALFGVATNVYENSGELALSDTQGNVTPIYQFDRGQTAGAGVYASDGNYYAVVWEERDGYICRVTPSGSLTQLVKLSGFFAGYPTTLIQASDGDLYGTTPLGGAHGTGSVFKMTLQGQYTEIYSFEAAPNAYPTTLIAGSDGNLYGATEGYLSPTLLFELSKSGIYIQLTQLPENQGCPCTLTQGSDGVIYGTAYGPEQGGYVFSLDNGLPEPKPQALQFTPQSGPAGTRVLLWGSNLLAATVSFNGVAGTAVSNNGTTYVWATVPAGASSGPITVTTPGGSSTTLGVFTVE
jgi:uncharacterized repeat protein (TIGR03803 family)